MKTKILSQLLIPFALCASATGVHGATMYSPYIFTTFAGKAGVVGSANGTGTSARFASPSGMGVDAANNVYIADTGNNTIRKITPAGVVTTLAGTAGMSGSADGTGSAARFTSPIGIALDAAGNIYVGDSGNNTIRKVTPAGVVTTFAGLAGVSGSANGTGNAARFNGPRGVAVDAAGNIFVADTFNNTIRKITPARVVSTFAGLAGVDGSKDGVGNVARFNRPRGVAVDSAGNVFVADTANSTVRRITPGRAVTTVAGVPGVSGSDDGSVFGAKFFGSIGIAVGQSGEIFLADTVNDTIRRISSTGVVNTLGGVPVVAGSANGSGAAARFASPQGIVMRSTGDILVADTGNNTIRRGVVGAPTPTPTPSVSPTPTPTPGPGPAQLLNIATRLRVQPDPNELIGGFIITGSAPKPILLRAIGPSLADAGVNDVLGDPTLELRAGDGSLIRSDDNWQDNAAQAALIQATGIPPQSTLESAIVATLSPGSYTAIMRGKNATSGVGLVEIYDLDRTVDSVLANISTRGLVKTNENVMIGGFILGEGGDDAPVLVRALGPSLAQAGISNVLPNPTLELRDVNGSLVASNDNWKSLQEAEIAATGVPPSNDLESAVIAALPPGNYTVIVSGKNDTTGVGLVEVFALQ